MEHLINAFEKPTADFNTSVSCNKRIPEVEIKLKSPIHMKHIAGVAVIGILVILTCGSCTGQQITKAEWLIGTWENSTPKGSIYESWTKVNDTEFAGKSYITQEKDTLVFETIRIVQERDALLYIPAVKNQNAGLPVRFTLKTISNTQLTFENQGHDFPQVISYTRISSDSLVAEISGMINGQERRETFPMKKLDE
jgi:hypothetical protein